MKAIDDSLESIAFPVLLVHPEEGVEPSIDADVFQTGTRMALEDGYYAGVEVFDSASHAFKIRAASELDDLGPAGITRKVRLTFDISEPRPVLFTDLRDSVAEHPEMVPFEAEVRQTEDFRELFALISRLYPYEI